MADIVFLCEKCGISIEASDTLCGGNATCPNCKNQVKVPPPLLQQGLDLNGFVLEKLLGSGGMGQVWLAHQTAMDRKIALKILDPGLAKNMEFVERFLREAKNLAKLSHNNIVNAIDAGYSRGIYYMAVGFVDGYELGNKLDQERLLPEKEAVGIMKGIAEGLCYAWNKHKIIHRDIKPANIMIDSEGIPKLMDLGISKSVGEDKSLTMTGVVVGTPYYISPEQGKGVRDIDFRADIYSLGASLYHAVTGELPFNGPTTISIITQHITEPFPPPRLKNPEVTEECSALLEIMMAKKPEQRQQSWEQVIADMRNVLEGSFPETKRPGAGASVITKSVNVQKSASAEKRASGKTNMAVQPPPVQLAQPKASSPARVFLAVFLIVILIALSAGITFLVLNSTRQSANSAQARPVPDQKTPAQPPQPVMPVAETGKHNTAAPDGHDKLPDKPKEPLKMLEPVAVHGDEKKAEPEKVPDVINIPVETDKKPTMPEKLFEVGEPTPQQVEKPVEQQPESPILKLKAELSSANPELLVDSVRMDVSDKGVWKIDLNNRPASNITPLAPLQISFLNLSRTGVSDISALKNTKLTELYLDWTNVTDLSPLKGHPIKILSLSGLNIKDFSLLKDMPLESLNLSETNVKDIGFLKGKQLKILSLRRTDVNDLTPLKGMKQLVQLSVFETSYKSLKPIEDIDLETITISPRFLNPETMKILKKMKSLKFIYPGPDNKMTAEEFFKRFSEQGPMMPPGGIRMRSN